MDENQEERRGLGERGSIRDSGQLKETPEKETRREIRKTVGLVPVLIVLALFFIIAGAKWRSEKRKPKVRVTNKEIKRGVFSRLKGR